MFVKSCENLNDDEAQQFSKLLTEYADVFSKGDKYVGHFKELKFTINTGDARQVQQRIRRTPLPAFIELGQFYGPYSQEGWFIDYRH